MQIGLACRSVDSTISSPADRNHQDTRDSGNGLPRSRVSDGGSDTSFDERHTFGTKEYRKEWPGGNVVGVRLRWAALSKAQRCGAGFLKDESGDRANSAWGARNVGPCLKKLSRKRGWSRATWRGARDIEKGKKVLRRWMNQNLSTHKDTRDGPDYIS